MNARALRRVIGWGALALSLVVSAIVLADAPNTNVLAPDEISPPRIIHLVGALFHVQGVDLDADFIYVTSVDKKAHRGYVHKFTRAGELVATVDVTEGARFHTGGIALDGASLWVPLAEYKAGGSTRILELDKTTLEPKSSFVVHDHIGAVTAHEGRLYGGNWGAKQIYAWDRHGAELDRTVNTSHVHYQDFKSADGVLVASGFMPDETSGTVDWLDPATLAPRQRLALGKMSGGRLWNQEGMALRDGKLYLLPVDGHDGGSELYEFDLTTLQIAAFDCAGDRRDCTAAKAIAAE